MAHHHHIQHTHVLVGELILAQLAQTFAFVQHHLAGTLLQISTEDFHESGFAATVRADQAVAVAVAELDGDIFKQGLCPELHGDVCGGKHAKPNSGKFWSAILTPHSIITFAIYLDRQPIRHIDIRSHGGYRQTKQLLDFS